jgi:hypothetical protein
VVFADLLDLGSVLDGRIKYGSSLAAEPDVESGGKDAEGRLVYQGDLEDRIFATVGRSWFLE